MRESTGKLHSGRVEVALSPPAFRETMAALLIEWGYTSHGDPPDILLENPGGDLCLRFRRSGTSSILSLPLDLQVLWRLLEEGFHTPPRRYFRRKLSLPAVLNLGYEVTETVLKSLSEMGARFDHPRELVRDQKMLVGMEIASRPLALKGRVIYVVPRGKRDGSTWMEAGLVFEDQDRETRELLRDFILWGFLDRVRNQTGRKIFEQGCSFLKIPSGVRRLFQAQP